MIFDAVHKLVSLAAFRSKDYGVRDLMLPRCFVDEGIILNKDGSFSATYFYSGLDLDSTDQNRLEQLNVNVFSNAFARLSGAWTMHLDCIHLESMGYISKNQNHFSNATSALIDLERRFLYEDSEQTHFENKFYLTFTWLPDSDVTQKLANYFLETPEKAIVDYQLYIGQFKTSINTVLDIISNDVYTKQLTSLEMLSHLNYRINNIKINFSERVLRYTLDNVIANQDFLGGFIPKIGDYYFQVISVGNGLPDEAYPAYLHALTTLPFEYHWTTRYSFFPREIANKILNNTTKYHHSKRESANTLENKFSGRNREDLGAAEDAVEGELALKASKRGELTHGLYTGTVIVFDTSLDNLKDKTKMVLKLLNERDFIAKNESYNIIEAYLGSIPGQVRPNLLNHLMNTVNLSDIMPTTSVWAGYDKNPCNFYKENNPVLFYASTDSGTPFRACLHVGDLGHTLVLGPPGAGKSVLLGFMASQFQRYKKAKVFFFDNGNSVLPLSYAVNGVNYDIGAEDGMNFQPLANLETFEDLEFIESWLCEIATLNGQTITARDRLDIKETINIIQTVSKPNQRTLEYFYIQLKPKNETLAEKFKNYTSFANSKALSTTIFNAKTDNLRLSDFTVFETKKLSGFSNMLKVPIFRYLCHSVNRQLTGEPTIIILEEGWSFIKEPIMQPVIVDWAKQIRKNNAILVIATQSVNDVLKSDIVDDLIDNFPTKILLPNNQIKNNELSLNDYYKLGLNDSQINLLVNSLPKRDYYFSNVIGNRLFSLDLGEIAKCFLTNSSMENIKMAKYMKSIHQDDFAYHWLKKFNLNDEADFWLEQTKQIKRGA